VAAFRDLKKLALARQLHADVQTPVDTICHMLKISRLTSSRYVTG
jgi:hypothetical protein